MEEEIKQIETTPVSETPVLLPKKNSLPKIVLLVVLGLLVAGGLVYAGMNIGKKQNPPEIVAKPTSAPQVAEPSPTPDPTANWKTFSNSLYGFTFKYPAGWEIETPPSPEVFVYGPKRKSSYPLHQIKFDIINAGDYNYTATAEKYLKKTFGGWGFSTKVFTTKIGGKDALYFEGELKLTDNIPYYSRVYVVKLDSGNFFEGIEYDSISGENRKTFDQILSTFKFLD